MLQRWAAPLAAAMGFEPRRDVDDPRLWGALSAVSLAGQVVTAETGLQHWAVQASLEALAGPLSSLPFMVFERLDGDKRRPAPEHPLYNVLRRTPNAWQTSQERRDEQARHLAWWRNSYDLIHPAEDGGPVGTLEQIHPSRVQKVERGSDGWVYYTVRRPKPQMGVDVYRADMIHHVRRAPLTDDGLQGRPVWETARETIGKAQAIEAFGALFFANGSHGGGVYKHPGNFKSKEDERDFVETLRAMRTGSNRFRDVLLKYGVDFVPNEITNEASQFLETKKQAGYEIAGLWNLPPHRIGILDRSTNNNIEQQSVEFVVYTLGSPIAAIEQAAERDLLVGDDRDRYFLEINVAGLLRGDLMTRWKAYSMGRNWGWLSVNDVRRLENMDPIGPDGDIYLQPVNTAKAGADPAQDGPAQQDSQDA